MEALFLQVAFFLYSVSLAFYLGYVFTKKESFASLAKSFLMGAVAFHAVWLGLRTIHARQMMQQGWYVPWSTWQESFSFLGFVVAVEYLIIQSAKPVPILGAFVVPLIWLSMLSAVNSPSEPGIKFLSTPLKSYWMAIHIPVMFVSSSLFTIAFAVGLAFIIQERQLKSKKPSHLAFRLPPLDELDGLIRILIWCAFPVLTVGMFIGVLWAHAVWGRPWGWDAKETAALLTWLVYAVYLFLREVNGWRGRRATYLSMFGFGVVLFTHVAVNFMSKLHKFLSGGLQ